MKSLSVLVLAIATTSFAQYDDYPVGDYEYPHHRVVYSPIKVFGGMDAAKRDEGPKVDLVWVPGIDIQELRYEFVDGPQGTYGWGPVVNLYLGLDSTKATSVAAGMYGRIYSGVGSGSYVQMGLQYYLQTGTYLFDGSPRPIKVGETIDTLAKTEVKVQGPQLSPVLGVQKIFDRRWILEGQMGFTVGYYTVEYVGAPSTFKVDRQGAKQPFPEGGSTDTFEAGSDWGGFYFVQIGLGVAF